VKPWKAIVAALLIFVAGAVSGGLAGHLYRAKSQKPPRALFLRGPAAPWLAQRLELLRRLEHKLNLTPAQCQRINRALHESQERIRELWQPVAPQAEEEMRQLHRRIEAELTPGQREQFKRLLKRRPPRPPAEQPGWRWRGDRDEAPPPRDKD
jgi:hypothetical protein